MTVLCDTSRLSSRVEIKLADVVEEGEHQDGHAEVADLFRLPKPQSGYNSGENHRLGARFGR